MQAWRRWPGHVAIRTWCRRRSLCPTGPISASPGRSLWITTATPCWNRGASRLPRADGRRRRGQRGGYLYYRRVRRIQRAVQGADGAPGCRGVVPAVTDTISYKLDGADELVEIL